MPCIIFIFFMHCTYLFLFTTTCLLHFRLHLSHSTISFILFLGNPMVSPGNDRYSSENSSSFVLLWSRERDNRHYSMINCETGVFYTHEQRCPGHRVLCMTRVENRTWLGTEVRCRWLTSVTEALTSVTDVGEILVKERGVTT